jgi:hypothetical protein
MLTWQKMMNSRHVRKKPVFCSAVEAEPPTYVGLSNACRLTLPTILRMLGTTVKRLLKCLPSSSVIIRITIIIIIISDLKEEDPSFKFYPRKEEK